MSTVRRGGPPGGGRGRRFAPCSSFAQPNRRQGSRPRVQTWEGVWALSLSARSWAPAPRLTPAAAASQQAGRHPAAEEGRGSPHPAGRAGRGRRGVAAGRRGGTARRSGWWRHRCLRAGQGAGRRAAHVAGVRARGDALLMLPGRQTHRPTQQAQQAAGTGACGAQLLLSGGGHSSARPAPPGIHTTPTRGVGARGGLVLRRLLGPATLGEGEQHGHSPDAKAGPGDGPHGCGKGMGGREQGGGG